MAGWVLVLCSSSLARFGENFLESCGQDARSEAKMAASCAQDGPRWRQDGHLGLNFGGFGAILGVTWTILGELGEDLGSVLAHGWDSKNLDSP